MLDFHLESDADCTVAAIPVPVRKRGPLGSSGSMSWRILSFKAKPEVPREIPGRPGFALASMGNYIFNTRVSSMSFCVMPKASSARTTSGATSA